MVLQNFWNHWKTEYLTLLRETHIANGTNKNTVKVDDVVIVHDDNIPRTKWRLAIVTELQQGHDGFVRSARIQTTNGITSRPIFKLYPLEVNIESTTSNNDSNDTQSTDGKAVNSSYSTTEELQKSTRPHRDAASKAKFRVKEWNEI